MLILHFAFKTLFLFCHCSHDILSTFFPVFCRLPKEHSCPSSNFLDISKRRQNYPKMNRSLIKFGTVAYYCLCLAGLLFQEVEISENYFKFQTVSEIKLVLPEEISKPKPVNICFFNSQVLNVAKYLLLRGKYAASVKDTLSVGDWSIGDRFQIAIEPKELFPNHFNVTEPFILGERLTCYQINLSTFSELCPINHESVYSVSHFLISISYALPRVEITRFIIHTSSILTPNVSTVIWIDDHEYNVTSLKYPYADDCFDYKSMVSRDNAINLCYFNHTNNLLESQNVRLSDDQYFNATMEKTNETILSFCRQKYFRKDCKQEKVFSRSTVQKMKFYGVPIAIMTRPSDDPSFDITSRPRIDPVDYVTFILSTVGTWFGLSILSFNPFYLVQKFSAKNRRKMSKRWRQAIINSR